MKKTLGSLLVGDTKIIFPILLFQLYARPGILKAFREDLLFNLLRLKSYVQTRLVLCEVNFEVKSPFFALATSLTSYVVRDILLVMMPVYLTLPK